MILFIAHTLLCCLVIIIILTTYKSLIIVAFRYDNKYLTPHILRCSSSIIIHISQTSLTLYRPTILNVPLGVRFLGSFTPCCSGTLPAPGPFLSHAATANTRGRDSFRDCVAELRKGKDSRN